MREALGPLLTALGATGRLPRAAACLAAFAALAAALWPIDDFAPPGPLEAHAAPPPPASEAVLARPLFDPGRRAWTARGGLADVIGTAPAAGRLRVKGIVVDGAARRALIDDGTGEPAWLGEGEGRGDWRLVAIAPDRVTLSDGAGPLNAEFLGDPVTLRPARRRGADAARLRPTLGTGVP
ncbi:hypothetical protein U8607_08525 [Methylobacterium durans]|uniref:hypothetical protein n=1 Tax=Methylobacterium durans TaxID=2202825 RepID=UPI002AFE61D3|nr:hypothetical protein [Methylobacterium durans]MEA1832127.1 hypothetical protein [Methylobacterium durans]